MRIIEKNIEMNDELASSVGKFYDSLQKLGTNIKFLTENKIEAKLKYGYQTTRVKIIINKTNINKCNIRIIGWSDDIWGFGAKNSIKRILNFYGNEDKIASFKDKRGFNAPALALLGYFFFFGMRAFIKNETIFNLIINDSGLILYSALAVGIMIFGYRLYTLKRFEKF